MASKTDVLGGRYLLVSLLGHGGMSDVYRAIDQRSGTVVAVKVVRSNDPEFARRLAQETQVLERLEHRGLIRLSLIHISEPTRQAEISYAVFCLKKKKK